MSCSQSPHLGEPDRHSISYFPSTNYDSVNVHIPKGYSFTSIPNKFTKNLILAQSNLLFTENIDDTLRKQLIDLLINRAITKKIYTLNKAIQLDNICKLQFIADLNTIKNIEAELVSIYVNRLSESIHPLFQNKIPYPNWKNISFNKLLLPCENLPVPKRAKLLPNAPREYRKGVHRGIDFFADWGTPVRAVAEGTVIRADHNFKEVSSALRSELLQKASQIHRTPSDVFEHVLLGKSVVLDHGLNFIPGYRVITIYAHLSHINKNVKPGVKIKKGEQLGKTGNTGMQASTLGKRDGSHLHWEMILQNKDGEFYTGQGLKYKELYPLLKSMFK